MYNDTPLAIDEEKEIYFQRLTLAPLKGEARCVEKAVNEHDAESEAKFSMHKSRTKIFTRKWLAVGLKRHTAVQTLHFYLDSSQKLTNLALSKAV